jgi:hypothetical protein
VRRLLALLLLPLLARAALAKLDGPAWAEAEKSFKALFAQPGRTEDKISLLKTLETDGDPRSWKLLADALLLEAGHATKLAESRDADLEKLQVLLGKRMKTPPEEAEMYSLQGKVGAAERMKADEDRVMKAVLASAVASGEDARKVVLAAARAHKDWPARAAAARLAATSPDDALSKQALTDLLDKEKDPRVKVAALDVLQAAGGTWWYPLVVNRVTDPDWGVQLVAVRIAGSHEMGKAIPALIQALATASPRVATEIGEALRKLTGQSIEPYPEPWAKWWEANRSKWGEDGRPLQPVIATPRAADVEFYGIKVQSSRVMFIIDISGSMKDEKKAPPPPPKRGPVTGEPVKPEPEPEGKFSGPKIEIAKQELRRAIRKLPKEAMFDIIAFNHSVQQWQPKMVPATEANKELAYAWVRDMAPSGGTYVDGALRLAFKMAGMGAYDHAYPGVGVDTMLVLSDGAPTDNAFPDCHLMPPDEILAHVREWNPQNRIKIHCVGIDVVVQGIDFLKKLAAQNGGTYIDG